MRFAPLAVTFSIVAQFALAEQGSIAAPKADVANYDPQLSAKEAVLANWELAASGIRAGEVMGAQVVALADKGVPYDALARQAQFAQKTMLQRYSSAYWIYGASDDLTRVAEGVLQGAVLSAEADCAEATCAEERAALRAAFVSANDAFEQAAASARGSLVARQDLPDRVLMAEQLALIADFLESDAWTEELAMAPLQRNADEIAARIVGVMALWQNVEPYVGLASPEIDDAINAAGRNLLRSLRRDMRNLDHLAADSAELAALIDAAQALAVEFRRASALFAV